MVPRGNIRTLGKKKLTVSLRTILRIKCILIHVYVKSSLCITTDTAERFIVCVV